MREFVRTAVILTPAREASRVGTALCRQDPQDPVDPVDPVDPADLVDPENCSKMCSFWLPTVVTAVLGSLGPPPRITPNPLGTPEVPQDPEL